MVRRVATCAAIVAAALYAACLLPSRYPCDDDEQCIVEQLRPARDNYFHWYDQVVAWLS